MRKRQSVAFRPLPSGPGLYSALCSLPKQKINCALAKTRRNSPSNSPKWQTHTHGLLTKTVQSKLPAGLGSWSKPLISRKRWNFSSAIATSALGRSRAHWFPPIMARSLICGCLFCCVVVVEGWRGGREVWRSICRDCHPFVRLDPTDYIIPRFGNRLLLNKAVIFHQDVNATNLLSVSVLVLELFCGYIGG